jgi:hypothetical protein
MSKPSSRAQLKEYCLRRLGKPVIEVNVDDDQIEDLIDDTIQLFNERVYNGVERVMLKYKFTEEDIENGRKKNTTTSSTDQNTSTPPRSLDFDEGRGYFTLPDHIIGVENIMPIANTYVNSMFGFRYQFFLNDFYNFYAYDILNLEMTMQYLETLEFLLEGKKVIRYNKVQNKLYVDVDWQRVAANDFMVIECYRALDPVTWPKIYNEIFVKQHLTSSIKKQWGQNLMKFQGIKMPGGVEFNGRQLYDDAVQELDKLMEQMSTTFELPPLDFVG